MDSSERLFLAREDLKKAADSLGELAEGNRELDIGAVRDAVQMALDATGEFVGECQEAVPFASTFLVMENGRAFWKCTHNPPHIVGM